MVLHYAKAVEAMRAGDRLAVHHPDPMKPAEVTRYWLVGAGKAVSSVAHRKMLEGDHLVPVGDGLFGAEISQTFEWRENP